jgi:hypothetical protein
VSNIGREMRGRVMEREISAEAEVVRGCFRGTGEERVVGGLGAGSAAGFGVVQLGSDPGELLVGVAALRSRSR